MRKKLLNTLVLLACCILANAQDSKDVTSSRAQSVYGELGGNGLFISVNYDTRFSKKQNGLGGRIGLGFIPGFSAGVVGISTILTVPAGINYLFGKGPNYLEAGAGATLFAGAVKFAGLAAGGTSVVFMPSVGYRYQPLKTGFTGRVVISPFIGGGEVNFWAGISAGYKF